MDYSVENDSGIHVAIIMDGNGRWALTKGKNRSFGHRAGAKSVRQIIETAPSLGITTLTLYAFSSENWQRPMGEVSTLMSLFKQYLEDECQRCLENDIRVSVIGRRDRLPGPLLNAIEQTEHATSHCKVMLLRIAVDYSARDAIRRAATDLKPNASSADFSHALNRVIHSPIGTPDVDLVIRTSGEQRLSNFLLWESAYAELLFVDKMWPDFASSDLRTALTDFRNRDRRFGSLNATGS